ncbi:hypothetical protein FHG64_08595 [Antarcticibacterium flavum]|uniref:Uncharacterized protein n=1 Tax=Antarcticibacterium flavum TaxID=2058175 RepID=A0A5B7X1H3_9FLAO|nr:MULTISPECIES: hypothetical protein [Antarcticibacterium]MCM4159039.1 hypothetical protein [Antarcticibacterium sp. W02-3]QCY69444.1 hypothetical protein FHG64_08595 [Antarcticibacterium flavum]
MVDLSLQMFFPTFVCVAIVFILFWKYVKKILPVSKRVPVIEGVKNYRRLHRINSHFWGIFSCFVVQILVYSIAPQFLFIFFPVDHLQHPVILGIGVLLLKFSLGIILIAQIQIDQKLTQITKENDQTILFKSLRRFEGLLISGMMLIFIGFSITIPSLFSLTLVIIGFYIYNKTI